METCSYLLVILDAVLLIAIMHAEARDELERERARQLMRERIVEGQRNRGPRAP
jgi:hypothetical protein